MRSRSRARDRSEGDKHLVGFVVGDVQYAVDIHHVREIVNPQATSPVPHVPPAVVGVADHRGDVVPIVDARRHFALPAAPPTRATKWILIRGGGQLLGLVVDRVTEVFGSSTPPRDPPPALGNPKVRGVAWVASRDDQLVFVLDADKLGLLVADLSAEIAASASELPPPHAGSPSRGPA
jgi:purine-binding chemotaxis protein CheW